MSSRIAQRLEQLQQEQQQVHAALAHLEQQRQTLLQRLLAVQGAVDVLQAMLDEDREEAASWEPVAP